jgi:hypothetical protein
MPQRTKSQRQEEVYPILQKLKELRLTPLVSPAIKDFYAQMQVYIQDGIKQTVHILIPELNVKLLGVLATELSERTWVKLTSSA